MLFIRCAVPACVHQQCARRICIVLFMIICVQLVHIDVRKSGVFARPLVLSISICLTHVAIWLCTATYEFHAHVCAHHPADQPGRFCHYIPTQCMECAHSMLHMYGSGVIELADACFNSNPQWMTTISRLSCRWHSPAHQHVAAIRPGHVRRRQPAVAIAGGGGRSSRIHSSGRGSLSTGAETSGRLRRTSTDRRPRGQRADDRCGQLPGRHPGHAERGLDGAHGQRWTTVLLQVSYMNYSHTHKSYRFHYFTLQLKRYHVFTIRLEWVVHGHKHVRLCDLLRVI